MHLTKKQTKMLRQILLAAGLLIFIRLMTPYWESHMGPFGSLYETAEGFRYRQPLLPLAYLIPYLTVGRVMIRRSASSVSRRVA